MAACFPNPLAPVQDSSSTAWQQVRTTADRKSSRRRTFRFTPASASWTNAVDIPLPKPARQRKDAAFDSPAERLSAVDACIDRRNENRPPPVPPEPKAARACRVMEARMRYDGPESHATSRGCPSSSNCSMDGSGAAFPRDRARRQPRGALKERKET